MKTTRTCSSVVLEVSPAQNRSGCFVLHVLKVIKDKKEKVRSVKVSTMKAN